MIPLKSRVDSRLTHQAFECVYEAISGPWTHADIGRQDFVKIRRELPLVQARSIEKSHPYLAWLREKAKEYHFTHLGPMLLAAVVISFFIYRQIADPFLDYKLGDTAKRHLVAQRTMEMIDEETTEAKRKSAIESVLPVYDYDRRLSFQIRSRINKAFSLVRRQHLAVVNLSGRKMAPGELEKLPAFTDAKKDFSEALEIDLSE